ncbi:single-stranded DNA-binding protein [Streptomyces xinghaiensis]|uniref:single-stranded DNA-binding protein n=1 Tax=Streptomyces xinghaiensis TaxID=1038928 RepID=UPI000688397D|nr:single-stranded DNA-binding protein [Streptomyces xinghaiensis]MZE80919.1 single-stranded DNA-binding protein [Streptomyces sp. SID5475]
MPGEPIVAFSGTVTGDPECRYHQDIPVARFRVVSTPRVWDARTRAWRDGPPQRHICTVWRKAAEHVMESLVDGVGIVVLGRITRTDGEAVHISVDDVGVSLRNRIAYTESALPSPLAAAPQTALRPEPAQPQNAENPGLPPSGGTPDWWHQARRSGWPGFAQTAARATTDPAVFHLS